jgi:hypothetical protein
MAKIKTFNLNEDLQHDYDDVNDLEMDKLLDGLGLVVGSISNSIIVCDYYMFGWKSKMTMHIFHPILN